MRGGVVKVVAGIVLLAAGGWGIARRLHSRQVDRNMTEVCRAQPPSLSVRPLQSPASLPNPARVPQPRQEIGEDPFSGVTTTPRQPVNRGAAPLTAVKSGRAVGGLLPAPGANARINSARSGRFAAGSSLVRGTAPVSRGIPLPAAPSRGTLMTVGGLNFTEEPIEQQQPLLILENGEAGRMEITLSGPKRFHRGIGPHSYVQLSVPAGTYSVEVRTSLPVRDRLGNLAIYTGHERGQGAFREYRRYFACLVTSVSNHQPIRLGELARDRSEPEEDAPVTPVPEER